MRLIENCARAALVEIVHAGAVLCERRAETIEPCLPVAAVARDPGLDLIERFLAQRIEPLLSVGTHLHDAGVGEDAQMPRNAGLLDVHACDDFADRALARLYRLQDAQPRRIGERVKGR